MESPSIEDTNEIVVEFINDQAVIHLIVDETLQS